jgi:hypothetical protein
MSLFGILKAASRTLAMIWCAGLSTANAGDCTLKQLASLDMVDAQANTVMVPATVNGTKEFMVVETASIMSGIFSDTGSKLGLQPIGPMAHGGALFNLQGNQLTSLVHISQFGFGDMIGNNLTFLWMSPPRDLHSAAAGFLGQDILRKYDLDLDFGAHKLRLFSPDHCEDRVVYWTTAYDEIPVTIRGGGRIEFTITLDGRSLRALINTGSPNTMISMGAANNLFGVTKDSPGVQTIGEVPPNYPIQYRYRFKALSFGNVQAPNPLIDLLPDTAKDRMQFLASPPFRPWIDVPPLFIGMDVLRKLHLYIAYREQKIYLTAADAGGLLAPSSLSPPRTSSHSR